MSDGILEFAELWRTNQQNERGQGGERGGDREKEKSFCGFFSSNLQVAYRIRRKLINL